METFIFILAGPTGSLIMKQTPLSTGVKMHINISGKVFS